MELRCEWGLDDKGRGKMGTGKERKLSNSSQEFGEVNLREHMLSHATKTAAAATTRAHASSFAQRCSIL